MVLGQEERLLVLRKVTEATERNSQDRECKAEESKTSREGRNSAANQQTRYVDWFEVTDGIFGDCRPSCGLAITPT